MSKPKKSRSYNRRTAEERIAELQKKIEAIKNRETAKELKKSDAHKKALSLVRQVDKCIDLAQEESNTTLHHALVSAREPLAAHLEAEGLKLPKPRKPRGRKPKNA